MTTPPVLISTPSDPAAANVSSRTGAPVAPRRDRTRRIACLLVPVIFALALTAGCRSANPGVSDRMASIIVTNHSSQEIDGAIHFVFEKHEYTEGKSDDYKLIFEKQGSFMSGVVYSDWYSGGVWERIKVFQRDWKPGQTVVECDGYMVKEHDDPMFSEEKREYKTKRTHLQNLLDEVALALKTGLVRTNSPAPAQLPATTNAPPAPK